MEAINKFIGAINRTNIERIVILAAIAFFCMLGMLKFGEVVCQRLEEEDIARQEHAIKVTNDVQNYINNR